MSKFQIRSRWSSEVKFECELSAEVEAAGYGMRLGFAVRKAIEARADLAGADLAGANLAGASLTDANLADANLAGANLARANLARANLAGASLTDANLARANLAGADLAGANLTDANLTDANLTAIKQDFLAEVLRLPNELNALRDALIAGRVNGSSYSGKCACLAGTLAKAHGEPDNYGGDNILAAPGVVFHASPFSPRERFFLAIREGDTPESNPASKIALEWTDEAIAIRDMIRATAPKPGAV